MLICLPLFVLLLVYCPGLFVFLGTIGRLCSVTVAIPGQLIYYVTLITVFIYS